MITLRASHKLVRFLWATPLLIVAMVIISLGEECPPCFYNQTPPNTTGNGTASDGRPILTVKIDSSGTLTTQEIRNQGPTRIFGMALPAAPVVFHTTVPLARGTKPREP